MNNYTKDWRPEEGKKYFISMAMHDVKATEDDAGNGYLEGYVTTFGNVDRGKERVNKGATIESLPTFIKEGWFAVGHDWGRMGIGFVVDAREDDHGTWVKFAYHSTKDAQDIRTKVNERIAAQKTVGLSIGYFIKDWKVVEGVLELTKIDLKEVSIVNVPMNPQAMAAAAKGVDGASVLDLEGLALVDVIGAYKEHVVAREEARHKESRELSEKNVAMIDAVVAAIDALDEQKQSLKALADRNRKGLESGSTASEEESTDDAGWKAQRERDEIRRQTFNQTGVVLS